LAAVLAHQIAHIAAHHGIRNGIGPDGKPIPLVFVGSWIGLKSTEFWSSGFCYPQSA
jgi:Peptidase family M48